jgi:phenylacetic acid degradation operon negative regulatory protein
MARKDLTATSKFLINLLLLGDTLSYVIGTPHTIQKRWAGKPSGFNSAIFYLAKRGVIKVVNKNNERFITLTKKGQLEALLMKARLQSPPKKWDGKWRMVMFDIPEDSHKRRDQLRSLLKRHGFYKLQASNYINPYPLNRDAIRYLESSKLIEYIRIAKIEELDNDITLRKHFKLPLT